MVTRRSSNALAPTDPTDPSQPAPTTEETPVRLDSVADLLAAIEALPEPARTAAADQVEQALTLPASAARMALGLLALDLCDEPGVVVATPAAPAAPAEVIVLPDALAVAASA